MLHDSLFLLRDIEENVFRVVHLHVLPFPVPAFSLDLVQASCVVHVFRHVCFIQSFDFLIVFKFFNKFFPVVLGSGLSDALGPDFAGGVALPDPDIGVFRA